MSLEIKTVKFLIELSTVYSVFTTKYWCKIYFLYSPDSLSFRRRSRLSLLRSAKESSSYFTQHNVLSSYNSTTVRLFQCTESVIMNWSTRNSLHIVFCNFLACSSKVLAPAQGTFPQLSTDRVGPKGELDHISEQANYPPYFNGNWSFQFSLWSYISLQRNFAIGSVSVEIWLHATLVTNPNSKSMTRIRDVRRSNIQNFKHNFPQFCIHANDLY